MSRDMRLNSPSLLLILCIVFGVSHACESNERHVMPWVCLERCNFTSAQIAVHVQTILSNADVFDTVSFELYNLGANGSLIRNNFTNVGPLFRQYDIILLLLLLLFFLFFYC